MSDSLSTMVMSLLGITIFLCFITGSVIPVIWGGVAAYGCIYATKYVSDHVD